MFGISGLELFIILLFGFLIFGPDKLPEIAKTVGKGIAKFRNAQQDMSDQLKNAALFDKDSEEPFKNPLDVISSTAKQAKEETEKARASVKRAADKAAEHSEGFAERKARYEQQRAAKKAAQAMTDDNKAAGSQAGSAETKPGDSRADDSSKLKEAAVAASEDDPKVDVAKKTIVEEED